MANVKPVDNTQPASPTEPKNVHNEFGIKIDANLGTYNKPRKTANGENDGLYGTSNITLKLFVKPKALLSKHAGMLFQAGDWIKTTDFDSTYSKSTNRVFFGPVAYFRPLENESHRVEFILSPTYFYGVDMNQPTSKDWESHEFGNYTSLAYLNKPSNVKIDIHNWFIKDLDLTLPKNTDADEMGVVVGSTLSWKPFAATKVPFVENMELYMRFRQWIWNIAPSNADAPWKNWQEMTFGISGQFDWSWVE